MITYLNKGKNKAALKYYKKMILRDPRSEYLKEIKKELDRRMN